MALTNEQLSRFLNDGAIVEYYTLGDRLPIRARFENDGFMGRWISQISGGKKNVDSITTDRARAWARAEDFCLVR